MNQSKTQTSSDNDLVGFRPFEPWRDNGYAEWRETKLKGYPIDGSRLLIEIKELSNLSNQERDLLLQGVRTRNFALFQTDPAAVSGTHELRRFGEQLGLNRLDTNLCADQDSITTLRVADGGRQRSYIPYTNRALSWHTDGYYNSSQRQIRAWLLYCAQDAAEGGSNSLMDHEIAYILLRDKNPEFISALMQNDAMTIPANETEGEPIRAAQTGPVFSVDPATGRLHMRYSARKRNIHWKQDDATVAAVSYLERLWSEDCPFVVRHRLAPGQGIVSNNVLHNRESFRDDPVMGRERLFFRARYYDRIADI